LQKLEPSSIKLFVPYNPAAGQQMVLVIQTPHQARMADLLSPNNVWQLDGTFGTSQYGCQLTTVVVANQVSTAFRFVSDEPADPLLTASLPV
jgi:hypothetical protein